MAGRRTLVEGLKSRQKADRQKEESFVFEDKPPKPKARPPKATPPKAPAIAEEKPSAPTAPVSPPNSLQALAGRVPLTTRIRPELAQALKRASLERQLAQETPNTVQDIVEQALEPWLKDKGYLKD
jgi:hypothetical protein